LLKLRISFILSLSIYFILLLVHLDMVRISYTFYFPCPEMHVAKGKFTVVEQTLVTFISPVIGHNSYLRSTVMRGILQLDTHILSSLT
jgi:hypothetical protein